jgi:hypothetical protein
MEDLSSLQYATGSVFGSSSSISSLDPEYFPVIPEVALNLNARGITPDPGFTDPTQVQEMITYFLNASASIPNVKYSADGLPISYTIAKNYLVDNEVPSFFTVAQSNQFFGTFLLGPGGVVASFVDVAMSKLMSNGSTLFATGTVDSFLFSRIDPFLATFGSSDLGASYSILGELQELLAYKETIWTGLNNSTSVSAF